MIRFFDPAIALMNRLTFRQRFILISALFVLPLILFIYLLASQMGIDIAVARKEMQGTRYLRPLSQALDTATTEKIVAHAYYVHDEPVQEEMLRLQAAIDQDLQGVESVDRDVNLSPAITAKLAALKDTWRDLKNPGRDTDLSALTDSRRTAFIMDIDSLIVAVGDSSGLILDPDLDSYYLMYNAVVVLPTTQALLSQLAFIGDNAIRHQHISPEERANVPILSGQVRSNVDTLKRGVGIALGNNPAHTINSDIQTQLESYGSATDAFLRRVDQVAERAVGLQAAPTDAPAAPNAAGYSAGVAASGTGDTGSNAISAVSQAALDAGGRQWDMDVANLDAVLQARIDRLDARRSQSIAIAIVLLLIVAYLVVGFYIVVLKAISSLQRASSHIVRTDLESLAAATAAVASGDLTATVGMSAQPLAVESRDELGALTIGFSEMIQRLRETGTSFEQMLLGLRTLVGQVGSHAATVNSASMHLAAAADQA